MSEDYRATRMIAIAVVLILALSFAASISGKYIEARWPQATEAKE